MREDLERMEKDKSYVYDREQKEREKEAPEDEIKIVEDFL